jgi:hypothetical protein
MLTVKRISVTTFVNSYPVSRDFNPASDGETDIGVGVGPQHLPVSSIILIYFAHCSCRDGTHLGSVEFGITIHRSHDPPSDNQARRRQPRTSAPAPEA